MHEAKSIVVVDDHSIFRAGVIQIFSASPELVVIGEGATSAEAISLVEELRPDVALLDVSMPGGGITAAGEIHHRWPDVKIIMLTVSEEEDSVLRALQAGASGYVLKGTPASGLISIVSSIANGEAYVPSNMALRLLTAVRAQQDPKSPSARLQLLSPKEQRVLRLIVGGLNNKEIALATGVQVKTVKFHVSNILSKLDVRSRVEAALIGQKYLIEVVTDLGVPITDLESNCT